ncbi:MAG TPA: UDP-glucose/GDP-mannose dehydrogenase family protein, partial [Sphingomicrobium sp.]|nr:UDP-glucose/GDP-mannose dehydrogenase family protein [Sphingomicrobium sp.]
MRIAMIGTGYVGLVSGTCLADFGHHVTCVDQDEAKIGGLLAGRMPIWEPGLEALVKSNVDRGRLEFTTELARALEGAEAVFIAVGTPSRRGDGHADLSFVFAAVEELSGLLKDPIVVVTKSTVPVGTGDKIAALLKEKGAPAGVSVASNPEFLREGAAIADFKHPDRILVGAEDDRAREALAEIYRPLFLNRAPMLFTSRRTAELTKYAANAFLATKISFINEMADLCEAVDADVQDLARGIGLDNRIGAKFLHAGPGYGGSCFPKDTLALLRTADEAGIEQRIVSTVVEVNDRRKKAMADRVREALGGSVEGKRIGVLGLTFKPNTDDMRDAPSIPLIEGLLAGGASIAAFDPVGREQA